MYTVITSVKEESKFHSILLPSLLRIRKYLHDRNLPDIQILIVSGPESLTKNYNEGLRNSKYKLKFFIHDDIDLMDNELVPLFIRVDCLFDLSPNIGLIGLVGTTEHSKTGCWWDTHPSSHVGHVLMGGGEYWKWNVDKESYSNVKQIDGIFMATNRNIEFSEDIKGWTLYDADYSYVIKKAGYDIKVIPHLTCHKSKNLPQEFYKENYEELYSYYQKKWNLND